MPPDASKHLSQESINGVTVVTLVGPQFDAEPKEALYEVANGLSSAPEPRRVVLNLENVKALNSAAIGLLVNFQKRIREARGSLKVCNLDPYVRRLMELTKMDQVIDLVHGTTPDAIAAFSAPPGGKARGSSEEGGSWFSKVFGGS